MTIKEAIDTLKYANTDYRTRQAIDLAIDALEAMQDKIQLSDGRIVDISKVMILDRSE